MKVPFADLKVQYHSIKQEIDTAIASVIADTAFIGGMHLTAFEKAFAEYQQTDICIGVGNGTDAIEIVMEALELPAGSEVIVPANSFIATSEAVTRAGYKVVFCDCDPSTYTISVEDVALKITPSTKAVIAVHLYGQPCDMGQLQALCESSKLYLIEDCAQAHGAEFSGRRVGTFGIAGTFSFYPGKNLGAYGDGGAIVTANEEFARKCRMIANHGRLAKYDHEFEGRNSRLDGLQAAILMAKLSHLEAWTEARIRNAALYRSLFQSSDVVLPGQVEETRHVYHLFVIQVENREALQKYLKELGVDTGVHYPILLPLLNAYAQHGHVPTDFPNAYAASQRILSLPMYPELSEEQIEYVCSTILQYAH